MAKKLSEQLAEMYLYGLALRRELTDKERAEIRFAWIAGYESYPETKSLRDSTNSGEVKS